MFLEDLCKGAFVGGGADGCNGPEESVCAEVVWQARQELGGGGGALLGHEYLLVELEDA